MTNIAVIKQVMRFGKVKVNNICIYELAGSSLEQTVDQDAYMR